MALDLAFDPRLLRQACVLALKVAAEGDLADPRIPSPTAIRPLFGFRKLSAAAYRRLRVAVESDDDFRLRVADEATELLVGRAGWLWLTQPEGWAADPVFETQASPRSGRGAGRRAGHQPGTDIAGPEVAGEQGDGVDDDEAATASGPPRLVSRLQAKLETARDQAQRAEAARRRAAEQRDEARSEAGRLVDERDLLKAEVDRLEVERNAAVRAQKALETELSQTRRDLKVAREATREAEAELAGRSLPATGAPDEGPGGSGEGPGTTGTARLAAAGSAPTETGSTAPGSSRSTSAGVGSSTDASTRSGPPATAVASDGQSPPSGPGEVAPAIDVAGARDAVFAAAAAAGEMARALGAAAAALDPAARRPGRVATRPEADPGEPVEEGHGASPGNVRRGSAGRAGTDRRAGRVRRRQPVVPPGLFTDSAEARRHLVADPAVLVVVDGYNLARSAWTGLLPEEERRRTVVLLEEAAARSGGEVTVVFDGDDTASAPAASRVLRVIFSPTGVTADEEIAALLAVTPVSQPMLVVSSDREVADDARRQGAVVLSSTDYLTALGR